MRSGRVHAVGKSPTTARHRENRRHRRHDRFGQVSAASCDALLIGAPHPPAHRGCGRCTALWTSLVISLRAGITKPTKFRRFSRFFEEAGIGVDNCSRHTLYCGRPVAYPEAGRERRRRSPLWTTRIDAFLRARCVGASAAVGTRRLINTSQLPAALPFRFKGRVPHLGAMPFVRCSIGLRHRACGQQSSPAMSAQLLPPCERAALMHSAAELSRAGPDSRPVHTPNDCGYPARPPQRSSACGQIAIASEG